MGCEEGRAPDFNGIESLPYCKRFESRISEYITPSMEKLTLIIFGETSSIAKSLLERIAVENITVKIKVVSSNDIVPGDLAAIDNWILSDEIGRVLVLYAWGVLYPKQLMEQSWEEISYSYFVNQVLPIALMQKLNARNVDFKFLYISSESATKGSFDDTYFTAKTAVERFIREYRLKHVDSSILAIAPSTIEDAGMTLRRLDRDRVNQYRNAHPKRRFLFSDEVSDLIYFLLFRASSYLTNEVISVDGGKFARMIK